MSFRVLVADALAKEGLDIFKRSASVEVVDRAGIKRSELLQVLPEFDALVVRSATQVDAEVIAAGKQLKVVGRAGIGVDNVDLGAATRAGVVVMNTPEGNATTTAEHAIALMFSLARMIPQASASLKAGQWEKKKFMGRELSGKTLGVIGLGNIGRIVANRAQGLHLQVLGHDPYLDAETAAKYGIELVGLEAMLRRADIVTVHAPLNEQTRGLISDAQIELMKPGVLLVNCARGGIYDEAALLRGLQAGKIGGVALDVFVSEPPPPGDPLVAHERVICTPHLGASTQEAQVQVSVDIAAQIVDFAQGGAARNAVNLPRVAAKELKAVAPLLDLAQRMGSFCAQLHMDRIKSLKVTTTGEIAPHAASLITTAAICGALQQALGRPVNFVNARVLGEERGLEVVEARSSRPESGYARTIEVCLTGPEETHCVSGTLFDDEPRFVEVDHIQLEAVPMGCLLLIHNHDRPGVIGHIGTVLGEAGINISRMHLGLGRATGTALSIVNIDQPAPAAVIQKLHANNVIWVRQVRL